MAEYPVSVVVNARKYGARGDGTTDDTSAITAAIAAAATVSTGAAVVRLTGAATFKVSSLSLTAGVALEGDGWGITTLQVNNSNASVNGGAGMQMGTGSIARGLTINGSCKAGIWTDVASNVLIENCEITGATNSSIGDTVAAGVLIGPGFTGLPGGGTGGTDITISRCYIHGNGSGLIGGNGQIYAYSDTQNVRINILNNKLMGAGVSAETISLYNAVDCLIDGNYIDQGNTQGASTTAGGYAVLLYTSAADEVDRNIISNNHIVNSAGSGIYYNMGPYVPDSGYSFATSQYPNCVISGNIIENTCQQELDSSLLVAGIACNAKGAIISNNQIITTGSNGAGISVQGNGAKVIGNHIQGVPSRPAINVAVIAPGTGGYIGDDHSGARTIVADNSIVDCLNHGIATNAVSIDQLKIANNTIGFNYASFTADHTTNKLTVAGITFANGQTVRVRTVGGALPTGLSATAVYYIISWNNTQPDAATFQLSTSSGGSVHSFSDNGSGLLEICLSPLSDGSGIYIQGGCTNSVIAGNQVEGVRRNGIAIVGAGSANNVIADNVVANISWDAANSYYAMFNQGTNTVITGNQIVGSTSQQYGLLDQGTYSLITGNNLLGASASSWDSTSILAGNWLETGDTVHRIIGGTKIALTSPAMTFQDTYGDSPTLQITPGNGSANVIINTAGQTIEVGNATQFDAAVTCTGSLSIDGLTTLGGSSSTDNIKVVSKTQTTIGAAGGASALPSTPLGYLLATINGAEVAIPYYNKS